MKTKIEKILAEFTQRFATDNLWKNEDGSEAYVAVGNMEEWLLTTLTTLATHAQREERERLAEKIKNMPIEHVGDSAKTVEQIVNYGFTHPQ